MFHISAYRNANASTTANTQVVAVADQIISRRNGNFFPVQRYNMPFVYAGGDELLRARLVTPEFRQFSSPYIRPVEPSDSPGDDPNVEDLRMNPLEIPQNEEISLQHTGSAALQPVVGMIGLQPRVVPLPPGRIYTMRGTATDTLVVGAWTDLTVTWEDSLPRGTYAIVGMVPFSAGAIAARFILDNQVLRPGGLGITTETNRTHPMFLNGGLGVWGTFDNEAFPDIEMLSAVADTAETIYMQYMKVG